LMSMSPDTSSGIEPYMPLALWKNKRRPWKKSVPLTPYKI
jgi:hypothetical protein